MKTKYLIILISTLNIAIGYSQVNFKIEIGFSGDVTMFGHYNPYNTYPFQYSEFNMEQPKNNVSNYGYVGFNILAGGRICFKNVSLLTQINYLHAINGPINYNLRRFRNTELLGINLEFRLLERHRFKPFFTIRTYSEISNKYRNTIMENFGVTGSKGPIFVSSYYQGHNTPPTEMAEMTTYQSTPFIGELLVGCAFEAWKNLSLNLSVGYNLSILNYKYAKFEYDNYLHSDYVALLDESPIRHVLLHSFTVQLGLSYAFDIHNKQPKTTTP